MFYAIGFLHATVIHEAVCNNWLREPGCVQDYGNVYGFQFFVFDV